MILNAGEPIFLKVPASYSSPFPSFDSEMDAKFKALTDGNGVWGPRLAAERAAEGFSSALSVCNFAKATQVGDLLNSVLPRVAWMKSGKTGQVPMGMFATPVFNLGGANPDVPEQLAQAVVENMVQVGLTVAMTTLSAIPVYGQVAAAVIFVANALYKLISAKLEAAEKRLLLPWSEYSRDIDEDTIELAKQRFFAEVDWTDLFMPIFDEAPWQFAVAPGKGYVFMPVAGGEPAFNSSGFGCLPGTFRVIAQAQQPVLKVYRDDLPVRPRRWKDSLEQVWFSSPTTNVGSFRPALAQLGGAAWSQLMTPGNPDMYKVRVSAVRSAWQGFFGNLYETAGDLVSAATARLTTPEARQSMRASQCVEMYLAYRHRNQQEWLMGVPPGWRPGHFWHPDFFRSGPVRPEHRTQCFMVEQDLPGAKDRQGRPILDWPYGTSPREAQGSQYRARLEAPGLKALGTGFARPASVISPGGKVPKGYRCLAWPTAEMASASWASPYDVFTAPQLTTLEERQLLCLRQSLVSAYVRPHDVGDLPAYAAFVGKPGEKLRAECDAVRAKLLTSPARFKVDLQDVDSIDPTFAEKLRASGVNNSFAQKALATNKLAGGPVDDDTPLPPAPPPGGGYAFGGSFGGEKRDAGGGKALAALLALLAGYTALR